MPEPDHVRSPRTGYTRAHWEAAADGLLRAAWRWATPHGALLDLPGRASRSGTRSDGLEGYARTFLAAAFRTAGASGADPAGLLERYADGLTAGTRTPGRDDAESWPLIGDYTTAGQPMVEAASVALALRLTRPWLWDRLDDDTRARAEEWLRGALRHTPAPNNWYLFPLGVAGFLESAGRGDAETRAAIERGLELLECWWRGEGWYADGDGRAFDHYNGWALHLYPLLHAHLAGDEALSARYGPRLREHLAGYAPTFGGDGAPLHFGRSLTYRFAACAAVGLGAVTGYTPLAPGVSRRLLSGTLRYFLERGAVDADGLLTLGWHGPHDATLQTYSGPASPYWASKGFVALLVPSEDPLWTATEEAAPSEGPDRALALTAPGLLVHSTGGDGLVRLHNHGSDTLRPWQAEVFEEEDPLYARFAYSTATGPTARGNPPDNHLALRLTGRPGAPAAWSVRRRVHPLGAASAPDGEWGWAASWHRPVFPAAVPAPPSLRVESVTVVCGRWEVRAHRVVGAPAGTRVRLTGWAAGEDLAAELVPLHGLAATDPLRAPHGTAYARWVRLPAVEGEVSGTGVYVAAAALGGGAGREGGRDGGRDAVRDAARPAVGDAARDAARDTARDAAPRVTVSEGAEQAVVIEWGGGAGRRVRVAFDPLTVEQPAGD
ncbi:DUF2264 domain-containing protein [Streptomyces sp. DW4-2]|uniref:DUF2264 domain-containing protein n=1 Tax=Streptomyces spirodelae TaxID=2812904 RepID=A0ABS3WNC1_9ACTN|nr:DUF2264 domain-containing protein [Streptomyces spirodelae]MBO8184600.1 DUF2264 domain-containing protein [Streptomyces spirodelae]